MRTSDPMRRQGPRGMTLIELMLSMAIAAVTLAVATALFTSISQVKRDGERLIEARGSAGVALSLVSFDVSNAGYRFAAAPFAVRVLNNVTGGESELSPITSTSNCGSASWGVAPGTDVLEVYQGFLSTSPAGNESFGACAGGNCSLTAPASGAPFGNPAAPPVANDIVLFQNRDTNAACLARVTGYAGPGNSMNVQLLKQDLTNASDANYPNCPSGGSMTLMRLGRRARYIVCAPPVAQPDQRPGLFRQESGPDGLLGPMTLVQEGVEDLQVAYRVANPTGGISGAGCTTLNGQSFCTCNAGQPCVNFDPSPTTNGPGVLDPSNPAPIVAKGIFGLRALNIGITSITMRARAPRGTASSIERTVRPALFDHAVGTVMSGDLRAQQQTSVLLENVTMVVP